MEVTVTRAFRIMESGQTRKYTPGDIANGDTAKFAVENGYAKAKSAPANKAQAPAANK